MIVIDIEVADGHPYTWMSCRQDHWEAENYDDSVKHRDGPSEEVVKWKVIEISSMYNVHKDDKDCSIDVVSLFICSSMTLKQSSL